MELRSRHGPGAVAGFLGRGNLVSEDPLGQRAHSQAPAAEDDFFRQLAGGELVNAQDPRATSQASEPRPSARGPLDPHGAHPIDLPAPQRDRRRSRPEPRGRAARQRDQGAGVGQRRLVAAGALVVGTLALALVVLGADQSDPPQATAAGPRGAPNGSPATEEAVLRAWWPQDGKTSVRERWRRDGETTIAGRLTGGDGEAVAGASVTVLAADATQPQGGNRTVGEVRTDREGRFEAAIALDEGAPRKRLTFSYLAYANDTVPTAEAQATLTVATPVSLDADLSRVDRGQAIDLGGRTAPGARVTLLARQPDSDQGQKLADVQADRDGRWQASVRAPRDAHAGRWSFRARVADSGEGGFVGAQSDPVSVEVR